MKIFNKHINTKNIITVTAIACMAFVIGYYTACNANIASEYSDNFKRISTDTKTQESVDTAGNVEMVGNSKDDPLIHFKMLQQDVETFKALMEDVKNELFVSDNT